MKKFLIAIGTILLLLAVGVFIAFNISGDSVAKKEADHSISAAALYAEYATNEKASNRKYIDKTIEVNGIISEISKDQQGATVLMFTEPGEFEGVMCTLVKEEDTSALKVGSQVKVKGQCTGKLDMTGVVINKGILLE